MLRFEKLTVKAQEALQDAHEVAARHENQEITPLHLLAALTNQADGVVPPLLARLGVRKETLSNEVERELGRLPKVQGFSDQRLGRALTRGVDATREQLLTGTRFADEQNGHAATCGYLGCQYDYVADCRALTDNVRVPAIRRRELRSG